MKNDLLVLILLIAFGVGAMWTFVAGFAFAFIGHAPSAIVFAAVFISTASVSLAGLIRYSGEPLSLTQARGLVGAGVFCGVGLIAAAVYPMFGRDVLLVLAVMFTALYAAARFDAGFVRGVGRD